MKNRTEYARKYKCKQYVSGAEQKSRIRHKLDISAANRLAGGEIIQAIQKQADTESTDQVRYDVPVIINRHNDTEKSDKQIKCHRYPKRSFINDRNNDQSRCHETIQHTAEREAVRHENDHIQHTI